MQPKNLLIFLPCQFIAQPIYYAFYASDLFMILYSCSGKQSGGFVSSSGALDGIIGFGQANTSILSQLASTGKVKKIFSHCLNHKGGGIFAIGEVVQPKVNRTKLVPNQYVALLLICVFPFHMTKSEH